MTFLQLWNQAFAWAIVGACAVSVTLAAVHAIQRRGGERVLALIKLLVVGWIGVEYVLYWLVWGISIPPQTFRPSIFSLVGLIIALQLRARLHETG